MSSHQSVFPAAELANWQALVEKVLKGAPPESLDRRDEDGLDIHAFYAVDDADGYAVPMGPRAANRLVHGWDISQPVMAVNAGDRNAIRATNQVILDAIGSGATSLTLFIDKPSADHFDLLFDQVVLPAIAIQICAGNDTPDVIRKLDMFVANHHQEYGPADLRVNPGYNPLCDGDAAFDAGFALDGAAASFSRGVNFDGWEWHNRGLSAAAEIGVTLAGLAALLRHCRDHDLADVVASCNATLALPADSFAGIAKIRAMRLGWAGLCEAFGVDHHPLFITGITSLRMTSVLDQDVNMLRNATALLGGAIGGADRMAGFAHDALTNESEAGRRLTRTTQLMMIEESGLARSVDPVAGAPFLEQRSDALSTAGWGVMQQIESEGGLDAGVKNGFVSSLAATATLDRNAALSAGRDQLVGVTLQPAAETPAKTGTLPDIVTGLRRPAELVEALRHAKSAQRILILMATETDQNEERHIRQWLAIAGLTAVTLPDGNAADIATIAPDTIILGTGANPTSLPGDAHIIAANDILKSDDQLGILADMIGGGG